MYNRLKPIGKYEHPANPPPTYKKFYSLGYKTFKIADIYLYPLANVKTKNTMGFSKVYHPSQQKEENKYTKSFNQIYARNLPY